MDKVWAFYASLTGIFYYGTIDKKRKAEKYAIIYCKAR